MSEGNQNPELSEDEILLLEDYLSGSEEELTPFGAQRRDFLRQVLAAGGGAIALQLLGSQAASAFSRHEIPVGELPGTAIENGVAVAFKINGIQKKLTVDSRMSLLDTIREKLQLTGSKKGCDHGQCGACTVIIDGRRVLSCLTLAATCEGRSVQTIEGMAQSGVLHPVQAAFIKNDAFQCGYCTSGQICSAVALLNEVKKGEASFVTANVRTKTPATMLSDDEIRERMSGNICRCGAYANIVAAIREVHSGKEVAQNWSFVTGTGQNEIARNDQNTQGPLL